jgi:S-layer family protein
LQAKSFAATGFADVPGRHRVFKAVRAAKEMGYLDYIPGDKFAPSQNISRAEVAYLLMKTPQAEKLVKEFNQ